MKYRLNCFFIILISLTLVFLLAGCDNNKKGTSIPETYSLTIDIIGDGTVTKTPDKESYEKNEKVTLKAVPAEWHNFAFWEGTYNLSKPETVIVMEKDTHLKANFGRIYKLLYFNDNEGWPVEEDDITKLALTDDGRYAITMKEENFIQRITMDIEVNNLYGEIELQFAKTDFYPGAGLVFNDTGTVFHFLEANHGGKYYIKKATIIDTGSINVNTVSSGNIPDYKKGELLKLAYSKKGSVYNLYINGYYVDHIEIDDIEPAFQLLAISGKEAPFTVYFDNLKILNLDPYLFTQKNIVPAAIKNIIEVSSEIVNK